MCVGRSGRGRHPNRDAGRATPKANRQRPKGEEPQAQEEVKKLKEELADEKKTNSMAATKLRQSLELVRKMEEVAQQQTKNPKQGQIL